MFEYFQKSATNLGRASDATGEIGRGEDEKENYASKFPRPSGLSGSIRESVQKQISLRKTQMIQSQQSSVILDAEQQDRLLGAGDQFTKQLNQRLSQLSDIQQIQDKKNSFQSPMRATALPPQYSRHEVDDEQQQSPARQSSTKA